MVAERCPNAVQCADAFHVTGPPKPSMKCAGRSGTRLAQSPVASRNGSGASAGRRAGPVARARASPALKHARYALWKNPADLIERQVEKPAWIAASHPMLCRAYLLKEGQ